MVKKYFPFLILVLFLASTSAFAIPQQINFQGRLTNQYGTPESGSKDMYFTIYSDEGGVTSVWGPETQTDVPVTNGLFNVQLGSVSPIPHSVFDGSDRWLGIRISPDLSEMIPRHKITSVGYAYRAATAESVVGAAGGWTTDGSTKTYTNYNVGIGTTSPYYPLEVVGAARVSNAFRLGWLVADNATNGYQFYNNAGTTVLMKINDTGNVGIGTTSPGYPLSVYTPSGYNYAIYASNSKGNTGSLTSVGVYGTGGATGVYGTNGTSSGGLGWCATPAIAGIAGVFGDQGAGDYAGYFNGNVYITGSLTKGSGSFLIDHPLDPKNKVLRHSFVESPDMKNVYDGIIVLNEKGEAEVELPKYFEALNKDFRYQLTSIGAAASLYIQEEIKNNKFVIAGGKPGMKVSWQITGVRKDAYAEKHPIVVEEEKGVNNKFTKGKYLHPEAFGEKPESELVSIK